MRDDHGGIQESLVSIQDLLRKADRILEECPSLGGPNQYDVPEMQAEYYIESAFLHTLVLLDFLDLSRTYDDTKKLYENAKKKGLLKTASGVDEPYLQWGAELHTVVEAISNACGAGPLVQFIKTDVTSIVRATLYSITDKRLFKGPPSKESEVHSRIEAILKTVFPDLKHKPPISKPIKNFEPDTGLPSVKTLIEYKFLSTSSDVKRVCDEVLADTRGYYSKDWQRFLYVVYETRRLKPEKEWNQLLSECGVARNTQVVVLYGEPVRRKKGVSRYSKT